MKLFHLYESKNTPCIVVDVQPEYTGINDGSELYWIDDMMRFLNKQGPVLMFVNAEDAGLTSDTVSGVKEYWEDSGYVPQKWHNTSIVDKGYGYFRGWMDQGVEDGVIIRAIRLMYQQRVNDSRLLFGGEDSAEYITGMKTLGVPTELINEPISVEWTSIAQLKQFGGGYLMGGGENECLKEITLLMNAFNIRYTLISEFIY